MSWFKNIMPLVLNFFRILLSSCCEGKEKLYIHKIWNLLNTSQLHYNETYLPKPFKMKKIKKKLDLQVSV